MAYVSTKLFIEPAQRAIRVELFFPTDLPAPQNEVRGVITLLHGLSNSALEWVNLSSAYRYASDKGYILIIPEAENSFYHDLRFGAPFYRIITSGKPLVIVDQKRNIGLLVIRKAVVKNIDVLPAPGLCAGTVWRWICRTGMPRLREPCCRKGFTICHFLYIHG